MNRSDFQNKRLYRSRRDTFFAGVCGGIGEYFSVDPALIRLGFVILTLATGGLGLIAYLIATVVIPEERNQEGHTMNNYTPNSQGNPTDNPEYKSTNTGSAQGQQDTQWNTAYYTQTTWEKPADNHGRRRYVGLMLVFLGAFLILKNFIPNLDFTFLGAGFLIFIGLSMMIKRR